MSIEDESQKNRQANYMLKPKVRKVTVNISVGKSGEPLEKAVTVLESLVGQTPIKRNARITIRDFGIRKGEPIATTVTLRKEKAETFLIKALQAVGNKISRKCFDKSGNFSFGIKEHIEISGTKYVPELGIFGMGISVTLGRPGYRVKERRWARSKIGSHHLLKPEDAIAFVKDTFGIEIT